MTGTVTVRVPFCGLPCAPLELIPRQDGGLEARGGCPACRDTAAGLGAGPDEGPRVEGRPAALDQALAAAAESLRGAKSLFVYGLSLSHGGAVRRATRLARALRGAIDVEGADRLDGEALATRTFGLATATFGEIRARADVVLLWGCDPRTTHPDLMPPRWESEDGSGKRTFVHVPPEDAGLGALLLLRSLLLESPSDPSAARRLPGAGLIDDAARALKNARYRVVVWDPKGTRRDEAAPLACALALLARDLNLAGRAALRSLGAGGNVAGAMAALAGTSGYGRAVGFHAATPRQSPERFAIGPMLAGGADLLLLVGARAVPDAGVSNMPAAVVVGPRRPDGLSREAIFIPCAVPALSRPGFFVLADGVPVPLRPVLPSSLPSEEEVLDALWERVADAAPKRTAEASR
jgi:formylmethanofuran dehydrogenase subunit B